MSLPVTLSSLRTRIILLACTRIFKHFSIAVSTLQSFKRLRTNRREEKQERGTLQAAHFYGWQDKCRRYSTGRVPQFDKNTTACTHRSNGLQTACQRTAPTKPQGCRQPNLSELAGSVCMCVHACLCVLSRDSFTSAAVLLCSSWRQRCSRWMGIAYCPHIHSAQSPAQTSAPTSPLLRTQVRTTHAHDPCAFSCGGCTLALSLASESSLSLSQ